jgi:hypothetical protein
MTTFHGLIDAFTKLIDEKFSHVYKTWGENLIAVLTIKPNIGIKKPIVDAHTYNILNHEYKEALSKKLRKEREKNILESIDSHKATIHKRFERKSGMADPEDAVKNNRYLTLTKLMDQCDAFNEETNSRITPTICVDKITSIKDMEHVEKLNLNEVVKKSRESDESKLIISDRVITEMHLLESDEDFYQKLKDCVTLLDKSREERESINIRKVIKKRFDIVKASVGLKINLMNSHIDKVIDRINPHHESQVCNQIDCLIPPPVSLVIKELINKSSIGCDQLGVFKKQVHDLFKQLFSSMINIIFDID